MAIKLLCVTVLVIIVLGSTIGFDFTNAQKNLDKGMVKDFKINPSKPSVFLEFEKFGEIIPRTSNVPTKAAFLKLTNNTALPIAVDANFDTKLLQSETLILSDGAAVKTIPNMSVVEVCFDVDVIPSTTSTKANSSILMGAQSIKNNPAENDKTTCFWRNTWRADEFGNGDRVWIKSKQSIIFSVPIEYLKENLKVSTLFSYEWEFNNGKLNFDEPKHKAYFYGSDLPR